MAILSASMDFHFLLIFALLNIAFAGSHAAVSDEIYWKSVFPNIPMPKGLKDLLSPVDPNGFGDLTMEDKSLKDPVSEPIPFSKWGEEESLNDPVSEPLPFSKWGGEERLNDPVSEPIPFSKWGEEESLNDPVSEPLPFSKWGDKERLNDPVSEPIPFSKWGEEESHKVTDNSFNLLGQEHTLSDDLLKQTKYGYPNPRKEFGDHNAATNETIYFLQKDLHVGMKVKLPLLVKPRSMRKFLPDRVAKSRPFSSDKLPEILKYYSIKAGSIKGNAMNETIRNCERRSTSGEDKYCATSLKSFVDLSVSRLGKSIQLLANEVANETKSPLFTIGRGVQSMGEKEIVCHMLQYPYVVFICHSINRTVVYKVPLIGTDGVKKANALAVCHKDTSTWSPNHPSFWILNIKPGTVPVCHFLVRDTLVWVSK